MQTISFYQGWTKKEAYLKALGVGLNKALQSFTVPISAQGIASVLDNDDLQNIEHWKVLTLYSFLRTGNVGALAITKNVKSIQLIGSDLRFSDIGM